MPATYLDLSNRVLRRLNEVEMTSSDFPTVRGVQALCKDAVKAAIANINQSEFEWPFNAAEHTDTLTIGREEYDWPTYFKVVDWNSFQIFDNAAAKPEFTKLDFIQRDEYYEKYRDENDTAGSLGLDKPRFVYPSHGNGYGITPSPDYEYSVRFRYFLNYAELNLYDDETRVPESFSSVIVDGALMHMYLFKDNVEAAQVSQALFMQGLKNLQTLYINNYEYITDHRVNF